MTGRKKRAFTIVIMAALVLGMSACKKDTSMIDKLAGQQYGTEEENTVDGKAGSTNGSEGEGNTAADAEAGEAGSTAVDAGAGEAGNTAGDAEAEGTGNTAGDAGADGTGNIAGDKEVRGSDLQLSKDTGAKTGTGKDTAADGKDKDGNSQTGESKDSPDVDLTKLSSNMVYAEVYNMMTKPEDYVGKTIKIQGVYYASYWEGTGKYYHCVLISDAAACCQNGIEFVWDDDTHVYPDEYPPDNTVIELTGVFELYEEEGQTYCHLKTDDIIVP
ncbi:MAG TPA: hypothetical protein GXX75_09180 [Clostridiales bacterium]|nr:hypothetical protein [Clostridiales bacterium]